MAEGTLAMRLLVPLLASLMLSGCDSNTSDTYTLYRNSPGIRDATYGREDMRIHVATFDAADNGNNYNQENCRIASEVFAKRPGVIARFWCEKGRYSR